MRSTFDDEEIEVKEEKLKAYVKKRLKETEGTELCSYFEDLDAWLRKHKHFSFEQFNDWKIQGYWYQNFCDFLCEISQFIKGNAEFTYEDGSPFKIVCNFNPNFEAEVSSLEWETLPFEIKCGACGKKVDLTKKRIIRTIKKGEYEDDSAYYCNTKCQIAGEL